MSDYPAFVKNPLNRIAPTAAVTAGTRTLHVFGGKRAKREREG